MYVLILALLLPSDTTQTTVIPKPLVQILSDAKDAAEESAITKLLQTDSVQDELAKHGIKLDRIPDIVCDLHARPFSSYDRNGNRRSLYVIDIYPKRRLTIPMKGVLVRVWFWKRLEVRGYSDRTKLISTMHVEADPQIPLPVVDCLVQRLVVPRVVRMAERSVIQLETRAIRRLAR